MKKKSSIKISGSLSKIKNIITTRRILFGAALAVFGLAAIFLHQTSFAERRQKNEQNIWQTAEKSELVNRAVGLPEDFQTLRLDKQRLAALLANAPHESRTPLRDSELVLQLPMPDGAFSRFKVQEAPILEESLQAQFPDIKSYRVVSIDDSGTTGRFDVSPRGFYATILSPDKTVSILPADTGDASLYISYDGASVPMVKGDNFSCSVGSGDNVSDNFKKNVLETAVPSGTPVTAVPINRKLKTYKIAISTTDEFRNDLVIGGSGTYEGTIASINTWMNAVNAIYERELSIRLIVVANPNTVFTTTTTTTPNGTTTDSYKDPADPLYPPGFDNLPRVRKVLKNAIGINNYNLGHLFRRNWSGGVGGLGVVCDGRNLGDADTDGPQKGGGETGFLSATDGGAVNRFNSIKLLAHEIGHQFGAKHTFNGLDCAGPANGTPPYGNRSADSAYEVGSGNTIMSYHGVCGSDNIIGEDSVTMRFHTHSFTQITNHVYNNTEAMTCGEFVDVKNSPPVVAPLTGPYRIPKFTPFTLTASATDPDASDNTNLTYAWEQYQTGGEWTQYPQNFGLESTYNDLGDTSITTRPIFRSVPATTNPSRTFPSLKYILNDANDPPHKEATVFNNQWITGEELPRIGRTLDFRVTVRDTVGGVAYQNMTVAVENNAGPFKVTQPNTSEVTWAGGSMQTVKWDVAGTNANGINTSQVKILLSTDGGQTFPNVLSYSAANTPNVPGEPNIASTVVTVPNNLSTTTARIKIQPNETEFGSIYFDISDKNFTITPSAGDCPIISSIFPSTAAVGSQLVIKGTNFIGVNSVVFSGGATVSNPSVNAGGTEITVTVPVGAQAGEITVKNSNGCQVKTGRMSLCGGSAQEISYDDGSPNIPGGAGATQYLVNRITPTQYPATLSEVRIYHPSGSLSNATPFLKTKAITILSAGHPSGSADISNTVFNEKAATVESYDNYVRYQVEPITITSGDFIVGLKVNNPASENTPRPFALDTTQLNQDRSYYSDNGLGWGVNTTVTHMIRATTFNGTATEFPAADDGSINATASAGVGTNYRVVRITPPAGSYPATLNEVRIYHYQTGFPKNKEITILSAASPGGNASNINYTAFNKKTATVREHNKFVTYSVDPITIYSGDFIIGYSFNRTANEAQNPVAVDNTSPKSRSFESADGVNFNLVTNANFMIRGAMTVSPCSNGACTYRVSLTNGVILGPGGSGTLRIDTQTGCQWKASRTANWITLTAPVNANNEVTGAGNGTVPFTVAANPTGAYRTGGISVLGRVMSFSQQQQTLTNLGEDPSDPEIYEAQAVPLIAQAPVAPPTAASVSISGRVLTATGNGLSGAIISLIDQTGETRIVRTNAFGYYRFDEIQAGSTVVLSVVSKRYTFTPRVVNAAETISDLNFVMPE